jgi:hypothetical protein
MLFFDYTTRKCKFEKYLYQNVSSRFWDEDARVISHWNFEKVYKEERLSVSKNHGWCIWEKDEYFQIILKRSLNTFSYYKVADKILRHLLFSHFLHERTLIIDIQIVISIALRMGCKPEMLTYS